MKSMCHDARRNSPSVAERSPTSRWSATTSRDRRVLDAAQLVGVDRAVGEPLPRLEQLGRAQQAADVVGAEGRSVSLCHGAPQIG